MSKNVLITGGTGLLGSHLTTLLLQKGYQVSYLSRNIEPIPHIKTYQWNVEEGTIDTKAIEQTDYIIHLAGAGVADKRWTKSRKQEIMESRTNSAALLFNALKTTKHQVKSVISASAIGYYGFDTGSQWVDENTQPGDDFLAEVVQAWESSVQQIASLGIRVVNLRIGIVLSEKGGALAKITQTIKVGAGAPLGTGKQYFSWIHIDDICRIFIHALENGQMQGIYNAVAPQPVTNEELTHQIAEVLDKPLVLPHVPAFALKLALGEMASAVLGGNKVANQKLLTTGYRFEFPELRPALEDLLKE
ncbi:TIGR01777 family protein [Rhodocytophaga rosea]|uniref:TIGR01777 family protein n=1 Tax=Rhodocytophaga rosea TaxID=2704465 RepID=A0A6C0GD28_9BACT|nr:TIGR01777 family oxidoreductase [Rhodocytophaga rosea]QHT65875.1 TIGR01777 family protein [Rhodocytophaga rosea]